jgi:hypothetical protein
MQTYETTIFVWSNIGNTPITNRDGAYCDELLKLTIQCANPAKAKALTQRLVKETEHGYKGYFNMPGYPNQNTRNGFTH